MLQVIDSVRPAGCIRPALLAAMIAVAIIIIVVSPVVDLPPGVAAGGILFLLDALSVLRTGLCASCRVVLCGFSRSEPAGVVLSGARRSWILRC